MSRRFVNVFDSNKFDDFDIKILRDWLLVMRDKLDRNVDYFVEIIANQTRLTRRNYVYERIFDTINNQILSQLYSEFNLFESLFIVENIFVFIKRSYDDSNRRDNAQRKIHDLKIKNRLFLKYLSDFNQYIDNYDYDSIFQLIVFEHDLFSKLKFQLINIALMKLSKFIKLCQTMNNKLRVINVNFYIKNKFKWFVSFTLVSSSIAFATLNSISNIDSWMFDVLELMNLFVNIVRSSLFETDKFKNRQHRIINDLCLYCDMFDHKIVDCLNKFKRRIDRINHIVVFLSWIYVITIEKRLVFVHSRAQRRLIKILILSILASMYSKVQSKQQLVKHLLLLCIIAYQNKFILFKTFVDIDAFKFNFIDQSYAQ